MFVNWNRNRKSQVQCPNHYTTEPPSLSLTTVCDKDVPRITITNCHISSMPTSFRDNCIVFVLAVWVSGMNYELILIMRYKYLMIQCRRSSTGQRGGALPPKPRPCPPMWHNELKASAYRCNKEHSLAFKICQNAFPTEAPPRTTLGNSRRSYPQNL